MKKSILVVIGIAMIFTSQTFAQDSRPRASWPGYALGILLGFGTGHYYFGENGTPFLVGEVVGFGGIVVGLVKLNNASLSSPTMTVGDALHSPEVSLALAGALVFWVSRIWEIADLFGAADRAKRAGRVADLCPVVNVQRTSHAPGISPLTSYEVGVLVKY